MAFFNKKPPVQPEAAPLVPAAPGGALQVKILGSGCDKCRQLEANAVQALQRAGIAYHLGHVTDFGQIAAYGVMTTPALVVNEKVLSAGQVLKPEQIIALLGK